MYGAVQGAAGKSCAAWGSRDKFLFGLTPVRAAGAARKAAGRQLTGLHPPAAAAWWHKRSYYAVAVLLPHRIKAACCCYAHLSNAVTVIHSHVPPSPHKVAHHPVQICLQTKGRVGACGRRVFERGTYSTASMTMPYNSYHKPHLRLGLSSVTNLKLWVWSDSEHTLATATPSFQAKWQYQMETRTTHTLRAEE
ncbi:hypothetical protein BDZ91DRAFT_826077 [Kalaharituber pfeilii]|nr:hypothetical protein BDZ91DRAFT_826077 [Kalaharituber pfeilii]